MKTRTFLRNLAGVAIAISILAPVTACLETTVGPVFEHALSHEPQFTERPETPAAESIPAGAIGIATVMQLQQIGKHPGYPRDGHYVLTQDIDASATANWNNGKGFEPVGMRERGQWNTAFDGVFDGRGHVITALTINRPDEDLVGLFGAIGRNSVIKRVGLRDANVAGQSAVALLVAYNGGHVKESYATGRVRGENTVGGLVGSNGGPVSDVYALVSVDGAWHSGGLVGTNGGEIIRCFVVGTVAEGEVNNNPLVGDMPDSGDVMGSLEHCFHHSSVTGHEDSYSWGSVACTTAEMQTRKTFTEAGWDFDEVWAIDEGESYPYLRWESRSRRDTR